MLIACFSGSVNHLHPTGCYLQVLHPPLWEALEQPAQSLPPPANSEKSFSVSVEPHDAQSGGVKSPIFLSSLVISLQTLQRNSYTGMRMLQNWNYTREQTLPKKYHDVHSRQIFSPL